MNFLKHSAAVAVLAFLAACAASRTQKMNSQISFFYSEKTYTIKSFNPDNQIGYNLLVLAENGRDVIRALDEQQDGIIDEVLTGSISLAEAQRVYAAGIVRGREQGTVKQRYVDRVYRCSDARHYYVLHTYELAVGQTYNRLVVQDRESSFFRTVLLDLDADGQLDKIEEDGDLDLGTYQVFYQDVITRGLFEGRIFVSNNRYLVTPR